MSVVCAVIPTYNEADNIEILIKEINKLNLDLELKIIIVDDNSSDGTADIAENLNKLYGNITVIKRNGKLGIGSAIIEGMKKALNFKDCQYIVTLDADFSHDPKDIPRLLKKSKNIDLVQGSRYINGGKIIGWNFYRRVISFCGNMLCRILFRTGMKEHTTYFRVYSRRLAEKIVKEVNTNGFEFAILSILCAKDGGFKIKEVPIKFENRKRGESKLELKDIIQWNAKVLYIFIMKITKRVGFYV